MHCTGNPFKVGAARVVVWHPSVNCNICTVRLHLQQIKHIGCWLVQNIGLTNTRFFYLKPSFFISLFLLLFFCMRDQAFGHCTGARCKGCQFIFLFLPFQYVEHRYSMLSIDRSVCSLCSWPKSMDQKWTALRPVAWTGTQLIIHICLFFLLGFKIEFTISGIHQMFGLALLCLSFWAFYIFCVSVVGICLVGSDSTWCLRRRSCSEHSVQMVCCVCLRKQTSMTIRELWKVEKTLAKSNRSRLSVSSNAMARLWLRLSHTISRPLLRCINTRSLGC